MNPNIFISSTIEDLRYLRVAIRTGIEEMGFSPVMSEFDEVGYIDTQNPTDACYRSIQDCDLAIFIIGRRYGSIGKSGISITHEEYRKAIEKNIPLLALVDKSVLYYKEVYDASNMTMDWALFRKMEQPKEVFQFIDEINGFPKPLIPFDDTTDAKNVIKKQIADFVGNKLRDSRQISDITNILAEVKTIRSAIENKQNTSEKKETNQRLFTLRYLLNNDVEEYKKILNMLFEDIDKALPYVIESKTFEDVVCKSSYKLKMTEDAKDGCIQAMRDGTGKGFAISIFGSYFLTENTLHIDNKARKYCDSQQENLQKNLKKFEATD